MAVDADATGLLVARGKGEVARSWPIAAAGARLRAEKA